MLAFAAAIALCPQTFPREGFEKHIRFLAQESMKGRKLGTPEGERAADYVAGRFKDLGLLPAGSEGYFHPFVLGHEAGRNVVARLAGGKTGEYLIVAAHHDARGVVAGAVQPGADDNASGVALVLELARSLVGEKLDRSILFISFDAEEQGLAGSREFVKAGIWPAESCVAAFVFDLVGGNFLPWDTHRLYALGSESSRTLHERLGPESQDPREFEVVRSSIRLIEPVPGTARSDYHEFRNRRVPFVFFSTGTPWYYHTAQDTVDVINFEKMAKIAAFLRRVILETAQDPNRPVFQPVRDAAEDAASVRRMLEEILDHRDSLKITPGQLEAAEKLHKSLRDQKDPPLGELQQGMGLLLSIARSQGTK
jgi:hypothetical protein